MRNIILFATAFASLLASAASATVHKETCSGADTGYKTLNKACANNPSSMMVNCANICTNFDIRTSKCLSWRTQEVASAICTSTGDKMLVRRCDDEQTEFAAQAIEKAREQAEKLSAALNALDLSELDVEAQRRFGYARHIAKGAANWLNHDRQFLCKSSEKTYCSGNLAMAIPLTGGLAAVRLCDAFFNLSVEKAGATIIHEATHSCCATSDREYYDVGPNDPPLSTQNWQNIADTYYYWAIKGLCIPGETECSANAATISEGDNGAASIAVGRGAGGGGGGSW